MVPISNTATPLLDVVIVNYRKASRLVENVRSLLATHPTLSMDIIVVDNSESDEEWRTLQLLGSITAVKLIRATRNLGYTAGCNVGAKMGNAPHILLLNPDILWTKGAALIPMLDYMERHMKTGIVGPRQINDDESTERTARRFPNLAALVLRRLPLRHLPGISWIVARYEATDFNYDQDGQADWLQSSCILLRRSLWDACGGLDDRYVLFMSDCEICYRAWELGLSVTYLSNARVQADGRRISAGGFITFFRSWILRRHLLDALRYQIRHLWKRNPRTSAVRG
jgi:N-acetylglucosaminyl-diphospho-decaprenol L-rhamnosyltransferase